MQDTINDNTMGLGRTVLLAALRQQGVLIITPFPETTLRSLLQIVQAHTVQNNGVQTEASDE